MNFDEVSDEADSEKLEFGRFRILKAIVYRNTEPGLSRKLTKTSQFSLQNLPLSEPVSLQTCFDGVLPRPDTEKLDSEGLRIRNPTVSRNR